jgi:hypothetical protein
LYNSHLRVILNDEPCRYDRNRYRKENKAIAQEYKELLRISYQTLSEEDKKLIRKAFDVSVEAHKEQRKSGEAYIFHPIAVAKIVASEIGLVRLRLPPHYYMM